MNRSLDAGIARAIDNRSSVRVCGNRVVVTGKALTFPLVSRMPDVRVMLQDVCANSPHYDPNISKEVLK